MNLYEIDKAISECVDLETGEVIDIERLSELQIERETKCENVALWIKNLNADLLALKAEKDAFAEREKQTKAKIESLKNWLSGALNGNPMKTTKVTVSFRKSESVEIEDEAIIPKKYLRIKKVVEPDKSSIKEALKTGKVKGCRIVVKNNIQIK